MIIVSILADIVFGGAAWVMALAATPVTAGVAFFFGMGGAAVAQVVALLGFWSFHTFRAPVRQRNEARAARASSSCV